MEIAIFIITAFSFITFFILFALTLQTLTKEKHKNFNNAIQNYDFELESKIDSMTARELYIHKATQNRLIWDSETQTYNKKME